MANNGDSNGNIGIYPIAHHFSREFLQDGAPQSTSVCAMCRSHVEVDADLYVEQVDIFVHRRCVGDFLCSEQGREFLEQGHAILVPALHLSLAPAGKDRE